MTMGLSTIALPSQVRIALGRARSEARLRGFQAVITSTFRTRSEQQFLFDQFQRGLTSFPVAPPGTSRHEFGLAVDLVVIPPNRLPELVEIMRSVGFRWAGPTDSVHFDYMLPVEGPRRTPRVSTRPQAGLLRPQQTLSSEKGRGEAPALPKCPL